MRRLVRPLCCVLAVQSIWLAAGCCGDIDSLPVAAEWSGLTATNMDNSGEWMVPAGPTVPAGAYGIDLQFSTGGTTHFRFSPVPAAYACGLSAGGFYTEDTVSAFNVELLTDGSGRHDVTGEFRVIDKEYGVPPLQQFITIGEFITRLNRPEGYSATRYQMIRISGSEPATGVHFIVTMELSSGKRIADTTDTITLI